MKLILKALVVVKPLLLSMVLLPGQAHGQQGDPVVEVKAVELREMASQLWVPGTMVSLQDATIAAEIDGRIEWIAEVGSRVKAGEALARIDQRELALELKRNQSTIKRIEAERDYQSRQIKRLERLTSQHNSARSDLDEAQSRKQVLQQNLRNAVLASESTQLLIDKAMPRAPYDGVVAERSASVGEYTRTGAALIRFVNTDALEVSARAPISVAKHNRDGQTVLIKTDSRQALATLRRVVPVGDSRSRMVELRLVIEDSPWLIGEAVKVAVNQGEIRNTLTVPRDALVLRKSGISVYTVDAENTAHQIAVEVGAGDGSVVGVIGNIDASDRVIIRGAENLTNGQKVQLINRTGEKISALTF